MKIRSHSLKITLVNCAQDGVRRWTTRGHGLFKKN